MIGGLRYFALTVPMFDATRVNCARSVKQPSGFLTDRWVSTLKSKHRTANRHQNIDPKAFGAERRDGPPARCIAPLSSRHRLFWIQFEIDFHIVMIAIPEPGRQ